MIWSRNAWRLYVPVLLAIVFAELHCEAARVFTVADDIGLSHFGDPYTGQVDPITFSPNRRYFVIVTERGALEQNRPESTVRIYQTHDVQRDLTRAEKTCRPLFMFSKSTYKDGPIITHIRWLPDSSGFAFLQKSQSGSDQLFLFSMATKSIHALTAPDRHVTGFDIRDRYHYVYTILSPRIVEEAFEEKRSDGIIGTGRPLLNLMFPVDAHTVAISNFDLSELWAVRNRVRFRVNDQLSGQPLSVYSAGAGALALSPDGRSVVTVLPVRTVPIEWETLYDPPTPSFPYRFRHGQQNLNAFADGDNYASEYVLIDLASSRFKPLTDAPAGLAAGWWHDQKASWSSNGRAIVLSNTFLAPASGNSDAKSSRPCVAVITDRAQCVEYLKGQSEDGYHWVTSASFAMGNSRELVIKFLLSSSGGGSRGAITYIQSETGLWTPNSTLLESGLNEDKSQLNIVVEQSLNSPPVLVAIDNATKSSRVILDPNPKLKRIDLGNATVIRFKDKDGREWKAGLYKPTNYEYGKKYPLVIQTHGFIDNEFEPAGNYPTAFAARELASIGILVLQLPYCSNPPMITPEEGSCNVGIYEAAVKHLVADGLIDINKLGIVGFSRSCYWVLEVLTTSGLRFKAASITDGVNVGYLQYLTHVDYNQNDYANEYDSIIGSRPFGDGLQQWFKRSPDFNMDKINTPLQVVANGRAGLLKVWEPYAVLRYLNKPVDLIMLKQGTHVLSNPGNRMVSQGGTVDWFRFWLQGYEVQDPMKIDQYTRWRELRNLQMKNRKPVHQNDVN
jgi:dipeptidyl aminopeptidase/acylaminoacyl peptidase